MIPFEEVAVMDMNSAFYGVPPEELMENAGKGLVEEILKRYDERKIIFFCGTGNNGGDAYVAARYLLEKWKQRNITVFLIKGEENVRSDLSQKNLEKLDQDLLIEKELDLVDIEEDAILVDALLGTGIKGRIREPYRTVIQKINESPNSVISIDVPSGLGADLTVDPDLTITFHDVKEGMSKKNSGEIEIKDIGIPKKATDHTGPGEMLLYPRPQSDSHKGENGELLIVGGGPYTGAPVLAGKAAYRIGVDLVHLAVPSSIYEVVAGYSPNFIVHRLEGDRLHQKHVEKVLELSSEIDATIIGPGLGDHKETLEAVEKIVKKAEKPMLIDADGLKAFGDNRIEVNEDVVLTPHKGEFEMLVRGEGEFNDRADHYALQNDLTLLVKGKRDYITDGKRYRWNEFGNEGMTVGGTGDVLSGVVGGLMSKGLDGFKAARLGAYITCSAGDKAFQERSWGMITDDIIERLPSVLRE